MTALPGFEHCDAERAEVKAEECGKELTAELIKPAQSIERAAGALETMSPLFRGHGPQGELF